LHGAPLASGLVGVLIRHQLARHCLTCVSACRPIDVRSSHTARYDDGLRVDAVLPSQQRADDQVAGETVGGRAPVRRVEARWTQAKGVPGDE